MQIHAFKSLDISKRENCSICSLNKIVNLRFDLTGVQDIFGIGIFLRNQSIIYSVNYFTYYTFL